MVTTKKITAGNKTVRSNRNLFQCTSGVAAVEFALVGPIFLALVFSLFETGLLYTKIALTDNAVADVSRSIYVGAAQSDGSVTSDTLKEDICDSIFIVQDCLNNITIEVTTISDFNSIPTGGEICQDSFDSGPPPATTYSPGASSQISFVRVCVTTKIITPFLGLGLKLTKNANNRFEIISTLAFVNEPF